MIKLLIEFLRCAERFKSFELNVLSLFIVDFGAANGMKYNVWFKSLLIRLFNKCIFAICDGSSFP